MAPLHAPKRTSPRGRCDRGGRAITRVGVIAVVGACALFSGAADAPTGGDPTVRTFVLSTLYFANPEEAGACKVYADGGLEAFYKMLPPAEQAKYATPDRRPALEAAMAAHFGFRRLSLQRGDFGGRALQAKLPPWFSPETPRTPEAAREIGALNGFPKGRGSFAYQNQTVAYSACTNPEDFPALAKGFKTYDGARAAGLDLDGKVARDDFVAPDGRRGVDNQLWRAIGCIKIFDEQGDAKVAAKTLISARAPTVIEIRGVTDPRNDPEVAVDIYAAADPVLRDARGGALARASFAIDPNPRLHAATRGKIVDGVLTTEPVDLLLNFREQIVDAPREIRGARLRAVLKPDGSIEGTLGGYYTLRSFYSSVEQMTQNGANLSGVNCPGVRRAIDRLADGYPDPRTGRYTAISSSLSFFGVPAFIIGEAGGRLAEPRS